MAYEPEYISASTWGSPWGMFPVFAKDVSATEFSPTLNAAAHTGLPPLFYDQNGRVWEAVNYKQYHDRGGL